MKKYKLYPTSSYYHYQQQKKRNRKILSVLFALIVVLGVFIWCGMDGRFGEDGVPFLPFSDSKGSYSEPVYLDTYPINYQLFRKPVNIKGIYIPPGKINEYEKYILMAKEAGINAFVIDIKNDKGNLTYDSSCEEAIEVGAVLSKPNIQDMKRMISRLYEENIYPIARVVAFKDNIVPLKYPERAVQSKKGGVYLTSGSDMWLDPYNQENWDYLLSICDEVVDMGFKEIQFDYVRFHESMDEERVILNPNITKEEIITEYTRYACEHLQSRGAYVSADVFGTVILSKLDASIVGQNFTKMSQYLDYICPMVYPSHYAQGVFGIEYPHLDAYDIILNTMEMGQDLIRENEREKRRATIRPWLQDFTLKKLKPYLEYGPKEIKAQIKGTTDAGLDEWLFWNATGNYTFEGFRE